MPLFSVGWCGTRLEFLFLFVPGADITGNMQFLASAKLWAGLFSRARLSLLARWRMIARRRVRSVSRPRGLFPAHFRTTTFNALGIFLRSQLRLPTRLFLRLNPVLFFFYAAPICGLQ